MLTLSTFWARAVSDTSRMRIGYVAWLFVCIFLVLEKNRKESDETRAKTCLLQVRAFQIFKLQNPTSSDISDSLLFIQYGLSPHD